MEHFDTSLFFCPICTTEHPIAYAAPLDNCGCLFCRPCLGAYLISQLEETSRVHGRDTLHRTYFCGRRGLYIDDEGASHTITVVETRHGSGWDDCRLTILLENDEITTAPYWRVSFLTTLDNSQGTTDGFWACVCPGEQCKGIVTMTEAALIIPEAWEKYQEEEMTTNAKMNGCIQCPYPECRCLIERLSSDNQQPVESGEDHGKHYRYRCAACQKDFCGICLARPYHTGYNCRQFKTPNCRFCDEKLGDGEGGGPGIEEEEDEVAPEMSVRQLKQLLKDAGVDFSWCIEKSDFLFASQKVLSVCNREACRKLLKISCTKKLACGHKCCGCRQSPTYRHKCLPCYEPDCPASSSEFDGCQICWESFTKGPCIQLPCNHLIHLECARERIINGYPGPSIGFNHLYCSMCGTASRQQAPSQIATSHCSLDHPLLQKEVAPILKLREATVRLALTKLRTSPDKAAPEVQPGGEYEGRPADYALKKYLFYLCNKCKKPYYGGNRECQAAAENEAEFNAEELVCGGCCAREAGQNCGRHGTNFIEWKCRYCCDIACWFCHGNTHYCDACHRNLTRQCKPCQGAECPLKIDHPRPGTEFCLGCSLCRVIHE